MEIEKHQNEERIFSSDTFWKTFILKAHTSIKTEQKILDFKETLDMWQAPKGLGKKETKHRFAELVAGFANNQGGVIIVGVTDSQPRKIVGIGNDSKTIENEMKYTRSTISNYIEYDSEFVHLQQVVIPGENDNEILCLVIAIRQTRSRVGVKSLDGRSYSYPFREETGLVWKDPEKISSMKIHIKHNNYDFLNRLSQFILEA
ncbi:MAG: ATP-binding protein [Anaerolineales bacterium]|nr:ATP-binding protein [Anaerolineales bacterium]